MGFEPTRAEPIGLAVQRLNHSATSSPFKFSCDATKLFSSHPELVDDLENSSPRYVIITITAAFVVLRIMELHPDTCHSYSRE